MYRNNILNIQESTTILNANTKKVRKLIEGTTYLDLPNLNFTLSGFNSKVDYKIFYESGLLM